MVTAGGVSYGLKATIQIVTRKMNDRKSYRVTSIAPSLEETNRLPLLTTPACIITRKYLSVNCRFTLGLCQVLRIAMLHANASFASVRALVRLNTGEFLNALRLNDEIRRGRVARAVNVIQSHFADARVLGTFSHTTCFPISCVLWTCFLDRSVFPHLLH